MKKRSRAVVEVLETRQLLTQIGPDISFGDGGTVINTRSDVLLTTLPDGSVLAVEGNVGVGIVKFKADGTRDAGFGLNGEVDIRPHFLIKSAAVTKNHIFVTGASTDTPALHQILAFNISNGLLDKVFSGDGREFVPFKLANGKTSSGVAFAAALSPTKEGGVFVQAQSDNLSELIKIKPDGTVDTSFGNGGYVTLPSVGLLTANGVVVATNDENGNASMVRYSAKNGAIDKTFGVNGTVSLGMMFGPGLLEEPNGQLLAVGEDPDVSEATLVKRFNVNGSADSTFGTNGTATLVDHDAQSFDQQLAVDPSNRILVLSDSTVARLTSGGQLDTTFNGTGIFSTDTLHDGGPTSVTADSTGRVLVGTSTFTITRLDTVATVKVGVNHILYVEGSAADDTVSITDTSGTIHAVLNGVDSTFNDSDVDGFSVSAGEGKNHVTISIAKNAIVISGAGNDTISTAGGDDSISSGDGADSIVSGSGDDSVKTGAGDCFVSVGIGDDSVVSNSGNEHIVGGSTGFKQITYVGGATIQLGSGGSNIENFNLGASGDSSITIAGGDNTVDLDGDNTNTISIGGVGKNTVNAGIGANTITTGDGDDTINTQGADNINTAGGNDLIFGVNSGQTRTVVVNSGSGNDTIATGDAAANINAGNGNDLIKTGNQNDTILGGGGKDTIHAAGGDDYISGGGGNDRIFGQDGDDTILGGSGNDALYGNAGTNILSGQAGNDLLTGNMNDVLNGGPGNDVVVTS